MGAVASLGLQGELLKAVGLRRHILVGVGAGLLLLSAYLGIITAAQGLEHALTQTLGLWYWVVLLAAGFGVQVGLFSFIRQSLRQRQAVATASVATAWWRLGRLDGSLLCPSPERRLAPIQPIGAGCLSR